MPEYNSQNKNKEFKTASEKIEKPTYQPDKIEIPEEVKKKFEQLKTKLEGFKKELIKKFPEGAEITEEEKEKLAKQINVLILVEEREHQEEQKEKGQEKKQKEKGQEKKQKGKGDAEQKERDEIEPQKFIESVKKIAEGVDKSITPQIMNLDGLREACFDGKYEVLQLIAMSAPLYDPKDILMALKVAELHKAMVLKQFERYIISYVAAGSMFRGEKSNDIDVYVVVDDTDVKRMSRIELKDKLGAIIRSKGAEATMMTGIKKSFHIQVYILTEFWEAIKDAHPVIFTLLRDGVPLYDRGVFMPWKLLLKTGRIKPSPEAIDMHMDIGEKLLERIQFKMLSVVGEDLYYAMLNPAQAALMLYGITPPTPKETIELMDEIFVKKEKLIEEKYVKILEEIRRYYKDIEHGKIKKIEGKEIDRLLKNADEYLTRIKKLFEQINKRKESEDVVEMYNTCTSIALDVLSAENIKGDLANLLIVFKKELVDKKVIPEKLFEILKDIIKAKETYKQKKPSKPELEKLKKDARMFMKFFIEYIQRTRGIELERARVKVKYGKQFGEVLLLDNVAFLTMDIDAKEKEVQKAEITSDGGLKNLQKSSPVEMEKHLSEIKVIPERDFIKERCKWKSYY